VTEQERLAAALAYQQAQQPAMMNPNLARQGARGRENMMPPTSIMDERYPAFKRNQEDVEKLMLGLDIVGSAIPFAGPAMKGAKMLGQAAAPQIAQALENYTFKTGMALPMVAPEQFAQMATKGKVNLARSQEQELADLLAGKTKFAEARLNWDMPETYDLADKLAKHGLQSTVDARGVTRFYKNPEDLKAIESANNPASFGKAYGYSDNDIAAFYLARRQGNKDLAYKDYVNDLSTKAAPQDEALRLAQERAALPVERGGLGLPPNNTSEQRAAAMGFDTPAYHATDADISAFNNAKLGTNTAYLTGGDEDAIKSAMRGHWFSDRDLTNKDPRGYMFGDVSYPVKLANPKVINDKEFGSKSFIVKDSDNIRSRFAAFDPFRRNAATAAAMGVAAPDLLAKEKKK
jgi:hypothetical protein